MKKFLKILLFIVVVFIFSAFVTSSFSPNTIYTIDSATINYNVSQNGLVSVTKIYHIRMLEPYRFITLYEYLKFGKFIGEPFISSSKQARLEDFTSSDKKFATKIMFSKDMNTRIVPKEGGDEITVKVSYNADGVVEIGKDYKLLSMKVWNENIDTNVKKITFNYVGPKLINQIIYSGSPYKKITNNPVTYQFFNVKPNQQIVFDAYYGSSFNPIHFYSSNKDLKEIQVKQASKSLRIIWYFSIPILIIILYILIFKLFGTEYKTENYEYFREPPYEDSPILVNSIVKLSVQTPDRDGLNSLILKMVKNGVLKFIRSEKKKNDIIGFEIISKPSNKFEKNFIELFYDDPKPGSKIIFKEFERRLKGSTSEAKAFYEAFSDFKLSVLYEAQDRKFLSKKGYYVSLFVGVLSIINAIAIFFDFSSNYYSLASIMSSMQISAIISFAIGLLPFFLNSVIFGRWTKSGIEYYRKWKAFEKFLTDYSLISEKPPESIIVWEDYLIYATALGIAKEVRKNIDKLKIPNMEQNDIYYGTYGYYMGSLYYMSTIGAPKSSSSGGGGFSGSSSGGGFGGGGMSAG